MAIAGIFPVIGCIAQWYIIKARHELEWGGAIATWIVLIIPSAIIAIAIVLAFFGNLFVFMLFP
jgi:formate hydrogenlyase subunit 3/multisubunit Na+/H+ antiporter MnhD subunit